MYEEKNSGFSLRNLILQFLFIALFIFVLIWLFPMKSDVERLVNGNGSNSTTDLSMFYDQIFNNNVVAMKDAAKSYYTNERLPQNVGDKVSMTLREMLDQKIILPFVDSKGKQCDLDGSYVQITKSENEYVMKVNLNCPSSNQENYLLVYMGCYDYCTTAICEKNKSDVSKPVITPSRPTVNQTVNNITNNIEINHNVNVDIDVNINGGGSVTPPPDPPDPPEKEYEYEYIKKTEGKYTDWSAWSSWQTTYPTPSATVQVKYRDVTKKILTGYDVKTYKDYDKPIYGERTVEIGKVVENVCRSYEKVTTTTTTTQGTTTTVSSNVSYGDWYFAGYVSKTVPPTSSNSVRYELANNLVDFCDKNCTAGTTKIYKMYKRDVIKTGGGSSSSSSTSSSSTVSYRCADVDQVVRYLTAEKTVITGYKTYTEKTPTYRYETTRQYSYRTREFIPGSAKTVWSIYNDTTLLNQGYVYTGNKREKA